MCCNNCGAELDGDALFCTQCGAPVDRGGQEVSAAEPAPATEETLATGTVPAPQTTPASQPAPSTQLAHAAGEQEAWDTAHSSHALKVCVMSTGWDTSSGASKLPVHVTGTDLDGNDVDEVAYVDSAGDGISLVQGDYTLSVAASPLGSEGDVWGVPQGTIQVTVGDALGKDEPVDVSGDAQIPLGDPLDAADVTDDQIAAARDYAKKGGSETPDAADALANTATTRCDDAAQKRRAEALEATLASLHSVSMPVSYRDPGASPQVPYGYPAADIKATWKYPAVDGTDDASGAFNSAKKGAAEKLLSESASVTQDNGNQMTTEYSATGTAVGGSIVGVRTARLSHQTTTRGFWRITGEFWDLSCGKKASFSDVCQGVYGKSRDEVSALAAQAIAKCVNAPDSKGSFPDQLTSDNLSETVSDDSRYYGTPDGLVIAIWAGEYGCMAWDAHEIVVIPAAGSSHAAGDDVTAISYSPYS